LHGSSLLSPTGAHGITAPHLMQDQTAE
jgi:hypothetical protein